MLINDIYRWARIQPNKAAIIHNDKTVDYAGFARAIELTRRFLERLQLPREMTAVVVVIDLLDSWIIDIAFRPLGLKTVTVQSVRHAQDLKIPDVACVVTVESEAERFAFEEGAFGAAKFIVIPKSVQAGVSQGEVPAPVVDSESRGGQFLCTSGTTGSHKKLLLEGETEDARIAATTRAQGYDRDTVHHLAQMGLWTGVPQKQALAVWHVGGCVVTDQKTELGERFFRHSPNRCMLTVAVFNELVTSQADSGRHINKIEMGGGTPSLSIAQKALQISDQTLIIYSASELSTIPLLCDIQREMTAFWYYQANDRVTEIVDENYAECLTGQEGRLRVKLNELDSSCYVDDAEATSNAFHDGYFFPGDMAVKRADGRIRILGRVADVISLNGEKVAVAPIEQKLQRYLQVEDICLFSHLNDDGQNQLIVAMQSASMPSRAKLDNVRREFRLFENVRFAVLDAFPRTETGKVRRIVLKNFIQGSKATNA